MLTSRPECWSEPFSVTDPAGRVFRGRIAHASSCPADLIPHADIVLLCLPAYLVERTLCDIAPCLRPDTIVGSVVGNTGFFLFAHHSLPASTPLFAFQRVPFISRVVDYGRAANLLGYKDSLLVATEHIADVPAFCRRLSDLFLTPVSPLSSFYEVTLSNSNPILHTGRLYTLWHDWDGTTPYPDNPLFYYDWTDEVSALEIAMDDELFALLHALNVPTTHFSTLLSHYDATDAASLTRKLRSIPSYADIRSPMRPVSGGWVPDLSSRYFTEDFPFGLRLIRDLAHRHSVPCPTIDRVFLWGTSLIPHPSSLIPHA